MTNKGAICTILVQFCTHFVGLAIKELGETGRTGYGEGGAAAVGMESERDRRTVGRRRCEPRIHKELYNSFA